MVIDTVIVSNEGGNDTNFKNILILPVLDISSPFGYNNNDHFNFAIINGLLSNNFPLGAFSILCINVLSVILHVNEPVFDPVKV